MEEQQHSLESPLAYLSQTVVGSRWWAWCQRAWYGAAPRGQAGLGTQIKGRQGWEPLCLWSRVRVCVCVEARPTHTAQRPSSNTHRHTSLSFQNTQHFHKTAKQKKKVPHKTLWTSFIKTAIKSLSAIPIQLTDFPLSLSRLLIIRTPYNRPCMHFPLWFNKRNASRSLFSPSSSIFLEILPLSSFRWASASAVVFFPLPAGVPVMQ